MCGTLPHQLVDPRQNKSSLSPPLQVWYLRGGPFPGLWGVGIHDLFFGHRSLSLSLSLAAWSVWQMLNHLLGYFFGWGREGRRPVLSIYSTQVTIGGIGVMLLWVGPPPPPPPFHAFIAHFLYIYIRIWGSRDSYASEKQNKTKKRMSKKFGGRGG